MSIFTKAGKAIKKGLKQVSLKNIVKLGTPFLSMIPVVGGVVQSTVENASASAEARKQAKIAESQGNIAQAEALRIQADVLAQQSGALVGQQAGSVLKAFTKGATTEAIAQVSESTKTASGIIGASVVDSTIKEWFIQHWKMLVGVVVGLVTVFLVWKKSTSKKRPTLRGRR
jgi:multidrug efflux pump subunit AcrA (membrane-fusion protein)